MTYEELQQLAKAVAEACKETEGAWSYDRILQQLQSRQRMTSC
jgi:hypothetical protein